MTTRRIPGTRLRYAVSRPYSSNRVLSTADGTSPLLSEILLKAGVNVVALQRSESPQLTALAGKYPGVLVISKGDISKDEDNRVRREKWGREHREKQMNADGFSLSHLCRPRSTSRCSLSVALMPSFVSLKICSAPTG